MPNKNYIKGRRKEYKIVKQEKAKGRIAFRSAGSHSCIDVVSIDTEHRKIFLIQSKPYTWTEHQINKLLMDNELLNGVYDARFIIK
jgi:Holliday junction resolvase